MVDLYLSLSRRQREYFPEHIPSASRLSKTEISDDLEFFANHTALERNNPSKRKAALMLALEDEEQQEAAGSGPSAKRMRLIEKLQAELEQQAHLHTQHGDLRHQLEKTRQEVISYRDAMARVSREIRAAQLEREMLMQRYQDAEDELTNVKERVEHEQLTQAQQTERMRLLEAELKARDKRIAELQQQLQSLQSGGPGGDSKDSSASSSAAPMAIDSGDAKAKLEGGSVPRADLDRLRQQLQQARQELAEARAQARGESAKLKEAEARMQAVTLDSRKVAQRAQDLEHEIRSYEVRVNNMTELVHLADERAEESERTVRELMGQLAVLRGNMKQQQEQYEHAHAELRKVTNDREGREQHYASLQDRIRELEDQTDGAGEWRDRYNQLEAENNALSLQLKSTQEGETRARQDARAYKAHLDEIIMQQQLTQAESLKKLTTPASASSSSSAAAAAHHGHDEQQLHHYGAGSSAGADHDIEMRAAPSVPSHAAPAPVHHAPQAHLHHQQQSLPPLPSTLHQQQQQQQQQQAPAASSAASGPVLARVLQHPSPSSHGPASHAPAPSSVPHRAPQPLPPSMQPSSALPHAQQLALQAAAQAAAQAAQAAASAGLSHSSPHGLPIPPQQLHHQQQHHGNGYHH